MSERIRENLRVAQSEFAAAILEAQTDPGAVWDLEAGDLPPGIASAALKWANARVSSHRRPSGAMTNNLALWRDAIAKYRSENGRDPTVRELASALGRTHGPAHAAMKRLRELGEWPK